MMPKEWVPRWRRPSDEVSAPLSPGSTIAAESQARQRELQEQMARERRVQAWGVPPLSAEGRRPFEPLGDRPAAGDTRTPPSSPERGHPFEPQDRPAAGTRTPGGIQDASSPWRERLPSSPQAALDFDRTPDARGVSPPRPLDLDRTPEALGLSPRTPWLTAPLAYQTPEDQNGGPTSPGLYSDPAGASSSDAYPRRTRSRSPTPVEQQQLLEKVQEPLNLWERTQFRSPSRGFVALDPLPRGDPDVPASPTSPRIGSPSCSGLRSTPTCVGILGRTW